jgi:hypothetical protein
VARAVCEQVVRALARVDWPVLPHEGVEVVVLLGDDDEVAPQRLELRVLVSPVEEDPPGVGRHACGEGRQ